MNESSIHKLNLRLPVNLIEEARAEAAAMGVSLNAYILMAIRNFVPYTRRNRAGWDRIEAQQQRSLQGAERPSRQQAQVPKVGANQPCPCGSGQKYKRCHGKP